MINKSVVAAGILLSSLLSGALACAQPTFPEKPIRLLVPFSAGGSTDVFSRKFAEKFGKHLNQVIVVENKDGAAGSIAGSMLASAKPDGYTLMVGTSSNVTAGPATNAIFKYNPRKDFDSIGILAIQPMVLVTAKDVPANNLAEFIQLVKNHPNDYTYGSGGIGGISHLCGEFFKDKAGGLKILHVPYKGSAPVIQDLLAGRIHALFDSAVPNLPHYRDGKEKILAVFSNKRLSVLPEVPTTAESGYPDLISETVLFLLAPAGIPAPVLNKLHDAAQAVVSDRGFTNEMTEMGIESPGAVDAAAAEKYMEQDMAKWARVAKNIGLKLE